MKNKIVVRSIHGEIFLVQRGGPGSGNFGHAGRPGEVGGSSSNDGGQLYSILPHRSKAANKVLMAFDEEHRDAGIETVQFVDPQTGEVLFEKSGERGSVGVSAQQRRLAPGNILTHNHPSDELSPGGPLSFEDVVFFGQNGLREIRSNGGEFTDTLRWQEGILPPQKVGAFVDWAKKSDRAARAHVSKLIADGDDRVIQDGKILSKNAWEIHADVFFGNLTRQFSGLVREPFFRLSFIGRIDEDAMSDNSVFTLDMNAGAPYDCPSCPTVTYENFMKLLNGTATQVETIDGDMVGVGDAPFNIAHASDEEPDLD